MVFVIVIASILKTPPKAKTKKEIEEEERQRKRQEEWKEKADRNWFRNNYGADSYEEMYNPYANMQQNNDNAVNSTVDYPDFKAWMIGNSEFLRQILSESGEFTISKDVVGKYGDDFVNYCMQQSNIMEVNQEGNNYVVATY